MLHQAKSNLLSIKLWIGKRLFGQVGQSGVRIRPHRIIKGPYVHHHRDGLYLELGYINGIDLQAAWLGGCLSQDQKRHIITEVSGYINQLRSLEPPCKGIVSSADLEACHYHRIGSSTFGPFNEHAEFHSFLRRHIRIEDSTQVFSKEVTDCHSRWYRSCFTHADLCPRNIIVDNGKVAAVIDWESGGWYPEYWEYTKPHVSQIEMPEWYEGLKSAMARYDVELRAERTPWRQCDQPGIPLG
ncbi:kinase-like protein [Aspergillus bertholletiae]|uniref:Kinase-like protein n=1 Tax=Aspergillus bertholletiae TaxID=1226010 RepID=A0A5N7AN93_9EURO|nr:kinase-like protein [Aspergillus bertholletiae]